VRGGRGERTRRRTLKGEDIVQKKCQTTLGKRERGKWGVNGRETRPVTGAGNGRWIRHGTSGRKPTQHLQGRGKVKAASRKRRSNLRVVKKGGLKLLPILKK